jgi:ATP-dependent RNA helicase RhlE
LVEQEEPEQAEKLFRYSVKKRFFLRDIEKLVGLNLPKGNIRGFEADPNASKNQSNKDKEDNNAIQLKTKNRHYKPKQ